VATKTIIEAIREAMAEEMRRDERVIYTAFGALRLLNTPLTELDWPTT
jgi:pyruvate/2-oxoglutarate/acetoin dehydrogenase E1 component